MSNDELSQKDKTILNGRIYPAIQCCVNNRYKIVLGIFAYYSFIFTSDKLFEKAKTSNINLYASFLFTFFIFHNLVNYWNNNNDECKLEQRKCEFPTMEILFFIAAFILIWGAFGYFRILAN